MNSGFFDATSNIGVYTCYYNQILEYCQLQNMDFINFSNYILKKGVFFMDFATNLRRICQERGTSPTKLCIELGLSTNKVSLWNKGGLPKPEVLTKLAKKLECSVMDFFADEENLISKVEFALDDDEKDIIRLFRMLDRKQKHEFMTKAYAFEETLMKE